jgi:uncharacterized protein YjiS (DUF1127 family)
MRPYYFDLDQVQSRHDRAIAMARPVAWHRAPPPPRKPDPVELLQKALALVSLWRSRLRERRELATLDHRMRRDIGVTPSDIASECNKPFWRA